MDIELVNQKSNDKTKFTTFPVDQIRKDFPILKQKINGKPLVYLDNAATTHKPAPVIELIKSYYELNNSNIHRGIHTLSQRATTAFENARLKIQKFINAKEAKEIIFTRGTTEAINLVAQSYGRTFLRLGDEIIISLMEHHSNIVPWQLLAEQVGAILKIIPINERGEIVFTEYENLLSSKTKIVSIGHISNALGTINPLKKIIELAHQKNAVVIVDGAQAVSHTSVDVQELDCDFYAFSGHKLFGPTGVGVLYGKADLLESMPPYQGGGEMIKEVTFAKTTYHDLPHKFEAGTPHISGVIGLGAAVDYVSDIGLDNIAHYEHQLLAYATDAVNKIPEIRLIGTAENKTSILSFLMNDIHAHDIGTILDYDAIAVRSGHHCAMPTMEFFKIPATARASFAFYNTFEEIDCFIRALYKVREVLG